MVNVESCRSRELIRADTAPAHLIIIDNRSKYTIVDRQFGNNLAIIGVDLGQNAESTGTINEDRVRSMAGRV
jgi:hypothetical protein